MKSFKIIFEFKNAPDEISMPIAKEMVMQSIAAFPDDAPIDDGDEHLWVLEEIEVEVEEQRLNS